MANTEEKKFVEISAENQIQNILITQVRPQSEKSPYFELERKHAITLFFEPLIDIEPIAGKDFRKQKINITNFSGVIFTSRHAIDHFFRICEETKVSVSQDTKYFCITEAVALYLQKFILYRKRKVFFGTDGTNKSLFEVIHKHKENIKFLYVCSENQQDNEIVSWLKDKGREFELAFMYRAKSREITQALDGKEFDVVCFFTPASIRAWLDNYPDFKQNSVLIGTFGNNTRLAAEKAGLHPEIVAPLPKNPSMITALDNFLIDRKKKAL